MFTAFLQGLRQLVFPAVCSHCRVPLLHDTDRWCPSCLAALTQDGGETCPRCCSSVGPHTDLSEGCPRCRGETYYHDQAIRLGVYDGILRDMILHLKFGGEESLGWVIGYWWGNHAAARLRAADIEVVVPLPLHWWRRWQRGYNQSECLAEGLAEALALPLLRRVLRRVRSTTPQTSLDGQRRRDNVKGAFRCVSAPSIRGKSVLLVDDVLTTGSTCTQAARALKFGGARRVVVAVMAHR